MNKKGQKMILGFVFVLVGFLFMIGAFAFIEPLKESLETSRTDDALNCPGTTSFNQSDYDDDTDFEKLVRRPTCFATGLSLGYFILAFVIGIFMWISVQWGKLK